MNYIIFFSLFMTVFLWMAAIFSKNKEKSVVKKEKTNILKSWNSQLKAMLIKRKNTKQKRQLDRRLSGAGIPIKPEEFMAFQWLSALITGGVLHLLLHLFILSLVGLIIGYLIPVIWLKGKEQKRLRQFEEGLPNMLTSIISSLRAGFSFVQALQLVAEEADGPIKDEVSNLLKAMQYGTSMEEAMLDWKERLPSGDLGLLVDAILIQKQVGGNLAYLLEKIVETSRERKKLQNQIKSLTAQGKLSGMVIGGLPIGLGGIIFVINPEYITRLFTNPIGQVMLGVGAVGMVIGFILIRKIITIEV